MHSELYTFCTMYPLHCALYTLCTMHDMHCAPLVIIIGNPTHNRSRKLQTYVCIQYKYNVD